MRGRGDRLTLFFFSVKNTNHISTRSTREFTRKLMELRALFTTPPRHVHRDDGPGCHFTFFFFFFNTLAGFTLHPPSSAHGPL